MKPFRSPRRRSAWRVGAVALSLLAAAVSIRTAATAANSVPATVAAYDRIVSNGAIQIGVTFVLAPDGVTITGANITLQGNQTTRAVSAQFAAGPVASCTVGAYTAGTPGSTAVTCSGLSQTRNASTTFTITVV